MYKLTLFPILTLMFGVLLTANNSVLHSEAGAYPEQLPGAFTGGFGEETCHSCHFDYPLNPQDGSLLAEGFPKSYEPGQIYTFMLSIDRNDLGQAGFQLSSRFEDGRQAGSFKSNSDRLTFTKAENHLQYLQHSLKGSKVNNQSSAPWKITWIAPDTSSGKIIFNIAANAANGDASAFGDYIYVRQIEIPGPSN